MFKTLGKLICYESCWQKDLSEIRKEIPNLTDDQDGRALWFEVTTVKQYPRVLAKLTLARKFLWLKFIPMR